MLPATYMAPAGLLPHPLSLAFREMEQDEEDALRDSVTEQGVQLPITIYEGQVLDGRNRYRVALELGYDCPAVDLAPHLCPQRFVIALNTARRHLTSGQMALAVTKISAWRPVGKPASIELDLEDPIRKTTAELADLAGVHPITIKRAKTVQTHAEPEVVDAVERGVISLNKGAAIAKLPRDQQVEAISTPLAKLSNAKQAATSALSHTEPEDTQYVGPTRDEVDDTRAALDADLETLRQLLVADDKLAVLKADNDRLRAALAATELARDGYMRQSNELMSQVKVLKKKLARLEATDV